MTVLDSRCHTERQPLFTQALLTRLADAAARLHGARQAGDALLMAICTAELDDLRAVAERNDVDVTACELAAPGAHDGSMRSR
jgi:hypothetical protein